MNKTADILRRFVQENFLFGQELTFSDTDSFLDQGVIDSTGVLELVAFLEKEFSITIADEELVPENLDSIENLVRFVETKLDPSLMPTTDSPAIEAIGSAADDPRGAYCDSLGR